jgi:uncharacterized protein (TIGR03000 family)
MLRAIPLAILGLLGLLVLSGVRADCSDGPAQPARLEVRLPADARLLIDAAPTKSRGVIRIFTSPPLPLGENYQYTLEASWQGKVVVRQVQVTGGQTRVVEFRLGDFQAADGGTKENGEKIVLAKEGFAVEKHEGRLWVFREGSKELAEFKKSGPPEKHVARVNAAPLKLTVKAPDIATLEEYLTTKPGFVTRYDDGRLWVFRKGSKELASFQKDGELAKHVIRPGAGPRGMTLKAPDRETMDAYLKAAP